MTTSTVISALYGVARVTEGYNTERFEKLVEESTRYKSDEPALIQIAGLIKVLQEELRKETAKKGGKTNALSAAKRLLKLSQRDCMQYACVRDGKQIICNAYALVMLKKHLPLEPIPKNMDSLYPDVLKIIPREHGEEMELPELAKLKAFIKVDKAQHKGERGYVSAYDYGYDTMKFDAQQLADIMECLPNAKAYQGKNMIIFEDDEGNFGMLMGMRSNPNEERKKTEV